LGNRNDNLYYAARTCFALAEAGLLDTVDVERTLSGAARSAGLDATEIKSTMASARKSAWKKQAFAEELKARTVGAGEGRQD
jgi:hypothetical protein